MKRYVIEREIPAVGSHERAELRAGAAKSNAALAELGPAIQWVHSYVAQNKLFCVYLASGPEIIRRHASMSGFPAITITEIWKVIDPTTANPATNS